MFLTWQLTVGNRLESRPSFSNTLVWNNFPLPEIEKSVRNDVIERGRHVIASRESHAEKSLAALYEPDSMPFDLIDAHVALDKVVDGILGLTGDVITMEDRQSVLFQSYAKLDAGLLAGLVKTRRKGRKRA